MAAPNRPSSPNFGSQHIAIDPVPMQPPVMPVPIQQIISNAEQDAAADALFGQPQSIWQLSQRNRTYQIHYCRNYISNQVTPNDNHNRHVAQQLFHAQAGQHWTVIPHQQLMQISLRNLPPELPYEQWYELNHYVALAIQVNYLQQQGIVLEIA